MFHTIVCAIANNQQSLGYFFTRSLIHRPLLCHSSGSAASAATIVLAAAAKHVLQIVDLLDERCMNYTFPVSKQDVLMNAGFSILWQCMDLEEDSKLIKDNQKSLALLLAKVAKENNPASTEFQKVACGFVVIGSPRAGHPRYIPIDTPAARSLGTMPAPTSPKQSIARKQLQAIASRFSSFSSKDNNTEDVHRRKTISPHSAGVVLPTQNQRSNSSISLVSTQSAPVRHSATPSPRTTPAARPIAAATSAVNLDYFPMSNSLHPQQASHSSTSTMLPPKRQALSKNNSWEHLPSEFDSHTPELYHTVEPTALNKTISNPETSLDWTGDLWNLGSFSNIDKAHIPQSLLSFSEESLTSGDDFVFSTAGSHNGSMTTNDSIDSSAGEETFKGITMPVNTIEDELDFAPSIRV